MAGIFEVDGAKCVKCGACVRDCAFRALKMVDGTPRMAFPERCMKCQHCLAVCPTGAVTFDGKRPEDSVPVKDLPPLQSCPTLCDPIDGNPPGSPIPGILQAKTDRKSTRLNSSHQI